MAEAPATPMTVGGGARMLRNQYLAGFKGETYPTVPMPDEKAEAAFDGTIDDLSAQNPGLERVLYNDVKTCPKCGKPCAFTMKSCNSCDASLEGVAISKSENVFSAFLFGVKKAGKGFPYTISLRRQTDDVLIFDDMLALSPCHLNGVSARYYIPDWRFLLTDPKKALGLLDVLEAEMWECTQTFLNSPGYRKTIRGDVPDEQLKRMILKSFNFPPSQFQLHLQWQVPPLTPFQHFLTEKRVHFAEGRAFPLDYVRKILELNEPYRVHKDTPIQEIIDHFNAKGVDYKKSWGQFYETSLRGFLECANWDPKDFEYVVEGGKAHSFTVVDGELKRGDEVPGVVPGDVQNKDKVALQNYGRPYNEAGKTTGTYVKTALKPRIGPGGYEEWPGVFSELSSDCRCSLF